MNYTTYELEIDGSNTDDGGSTSKTIGVTHPDALRKVWAWAERFYPQHTIRLYAASIAVWDTESRSGEAGDIRPTQLDSKRLVASTDDYDTGRDWVGMAGLEVHIKAEIDLLTVESEDKG